MPAVRMPDRTPTFFIVGAPKAGTTSLYEWCKQHPSVFMSPIKEPCFFAPEVAHFTPRSTQAYLEDRADLRRWLDGARLERRSGGLVLDWQDYLSLFRDAGDAAALGEASGNYLASETAATAIRSRLPAARIVIMLRDPVDRLFSQYASARSAREADGTFGEWAKEQMRQEAGRSPRFGPVWTGMYAVHLRRWRASFAADQLRVFFFEDYSARPLELLSELFEFIGVEPYPAVDVTRRYNATTEPRWPAVHRRLRPAAAWAGAALPAGVLQRVRQWSRRPSTQRPSAGERAMVAGAYDADVVALQELVGRDLSHWRLARAAGSGPAS
jgi:hypothetical protein